MFRKITAIVLSAAMILGVFTGCDKKNVNLNSSSSSSASKTSSASSSVMNFTPPEKGEEIVVFTIKDYGQVKFKLFPNESPKGVENFKALVKSGYYNELIFHRVIKDFMIQGGDPKGNGTGGESTWGGQFDGGVSDNLFHFAGALAYANSGSTSTDGSQFYIVTGTSLTDDMIAQYSSKTGKKYSSDVSAKYKEVGGTPFLDGGYTVFGQVFDGLDVVFAISQAKTGANDKPDSQVVIEKAEVVQYNGEPINWTVNKENADKIAQEKAKK